MEAGMLEIVLHVNTVRQMYEKWLYSKRILWWEKIAGVSTMDEPDEFRRYAEERYPVVSALAAQMEINYGDGGDREKKAMGAVAWGGQPRPCRMVSRGCKKNHPLEDCELFKNQSLEAKLAKLQEWSRCLFCFKHLVGKECLAQEEDNYKGCGVIGCEKHHQASLHWVIETAKMF